MPEKVGFPETVPLRLRFPTLGVPVKLGLPEKVGAAIVPLTFNDAALIFPLTLSEEPERLPTTLIFVVEIVMIG